MLQSEKKALWMLLFNTLANRSMAVFGVGLVLCLGMGVEQAAATEPLLAQVVAAGNGPTESTGPTEPEWTKEAIQEQIQLLGSPEYRVRERSESVLRRLGSRAVEALLENSSNDDLEIKTRVKRLIAEMRTRFIHEAVPDFWMQLFDGYEDKDYAARQSLLMLLKEDTGVPVPGTIRLLARLARFEESDLLAKRAALIVMERDLESYPGGVVAAQAEIREGVELSRRVPAQWVRVYADSFDRSKNQQTIDACREMIQQQRDALHPSDKRAKEEIVQQLSRFFVRLMLRAELPEQAAEEIVRMIDDSDPTATEAIEFVDWLESLDESELVQMYYQKKTELFHANALLMYRMVRFYRDTGDDAASQAAGKAAFELAGSGVSEYLSEQELLLGSLLVRRLRRDLESDVPRRLATGKIIDKDYGLVDWAEKEYRDVIASGPEKTTDVPGKKLTMDGWQGQAYMALATELHDQLRDEEAAECVKTVLDACKVSREIFGLLGMRDSMTMDKLESQQNFYLACDAAAKKDFAAEREFLTKAIELDSQDVDVLIAMYRSKEASPEWKEQAEVRIVAMSSRLKKDLLRARNEVRMLPRSAGLMRNAAEIQVAALENQFAWLVGNTFGDIDEAILASEHSLEIIRGDGGLLDTLAHCLYRKGDLEGAVRVQTQAAEALPYEQQIQRQLVFFKRELQRQSES